MDERFLYWLHSVNWTVVAVRAVLILIGTNFWIVLALPRMLVMAMVAPIIWLRDLFLRH